MTSFKANGASTRSGAGGGHGVGYGGQSLMDIFIGSASAADLFFCIFVFIIYGIWDDLLCAIGFALKFCI